MSKEAHKKIIKIILGVSYAALCYTAPRAGLALLGVMSYLAFMCYISWAFYED